MQSLSQNCTNCMGGLQDHHLHSSSKNQIANRVTQNSKNKIEITVRGKRDPDYSHEFRSCCHAGPSQHAVGLCCCMCQVAYLVLVSGQSWGEVEACERDTSCHSHRRDLAPNHPWHACSDVCMRPAAGMEIAPEACSSTTASHAIGVLPANMQPKLHMSRA